MADPEIGAKFPAVMAMEPGTYHWCRCGRSKTQPFCDGAHKGTEYTPLEFVLGEKKQVALCQCKRTENPPFCDGAHKNL